ncbi:MAG TPA: HNH endonuclease [Acidimicrobiales bacterium]|nr:HNH endonuclease [Acidimicrobiales bacterium]
MTVPRPDFDLDRDQQLRAAAFAFLDTLAADGRSLVRQDDLTGFTFGGTSVRLMATQQGIWKPRQLNAALSFRTVYVEDPRRRPYEDGIGPDGYLRYKWRFTDPGDRGNYDRPDNRALRNAMNRGLPLILFEGVASGVYLPIYPVWLADEEPLAQQFVVSLDEESLRVRRDLALEDPALVRSYAERVVRARLHQPIFRQRVLLAYGNQCSLCHLRHTRLLDAAHVLADADGGEPIVTNGIAMCKIHHAAYDADIFGISPDYKVGVRPDVMTEIDGPTLRHTLQAIDGAVIGLPKQRSAKPNPELLDLRWRRFLEAC